jgi:hypothetical protein
MAHPEVFYKYMSARTAKIVLESSRLRWSSPQEFNDLSEFQRMPRFDPTIAEGLRKFPQLLLDVVSGTVEMDEESLTPSTQLLLSLLRRMPISPSMVDEISEALSPEEIANADNKAESTLREFVLGLNLKAFRILCVTVAPDNEAMWANYAEDNSGCVLGFRHLPTHDTPLLAARKVDYSEDAPVVGSGLDLLLYGDTRALASKTVQAICFTKKALWAYEQEWRAMTYRVTAQNSTYSDFKFYAEELESITFGPNINIAIAEELRALVREKYKSCMLHRFEVKAGRAVRSVLYPGSQEA